MVRVVEVINIDYFFLLLLLNREDFAGSTIVVNLTLYSTPYTTSILIFSVIAGARVL